MHIVIFSGGEYTTTSLSQKAIQSADAIIAADFGAVHSIKSGSIPDVVVGDFDSIVPEIKEKLKKQKVPFVTFQKEKDETDTELAIEHAKKLGATTITIPGGIAGDRIDHIMATILLSSTVDIPLKFIHGNQIAFVVKGPSTFSLSGKKGDLLSLIPINGDIEGITTKNLQYSLLDGTLSFGKPRGVSNVFLGKTIQISFKKGHLFVVHTTS